MKSHKTWNTVACFAIFLMNLHLTSGTVEVTTTEEPYIGESFTIICAITPFSGSATWAQDTTVHTNCVSAFCSPSTKGNYTFTNSATGISVTIKPVSSSAQGAWRCTHGLENDTYSLLPKERPSDVTTQGSTEGKPSEDSSDTDPGVIGGSTAAAIVGVGGTGGIIYKIMTDKKKKGGSDEEQNKTKKDKKKDSDEEQDKVEHLDESQPKDKKSDKKHQKDGTNDSLLKAVPFNRLPPLNVEEIKKEKEKETHENKTQ